MFLILLFSLSNLSLIIFSSYCSQDILLLCIKLYGNQHLKSMGCSGLVPKLHILKYLQESWSFVDNKIHIWSISPHISQIKPTWNYTPLTYCEAIYYFCCKKPEHLRTTPMFTAPFGHAPIYLSPRCFWKPFFCVFEGWNYVDLWNVFVGEMWAWLCSTCFCSFSVLPSLCSHGQPAIGRIGTIRRQKVKNNCMASF